MRELNFYTLFGCLFNHYSMRKRDEFEFSKYLSSSNLNNLIEIEFGFGTLNGDV